MNRFFVQRRLIADITKKRMITLPFSNFIFESELFRAFNIPSPSTYFFIMLLISMRLAEVFLEDWREIST